MKGERTRILLTLAVALGVGFLVAFLRQRRLRRRRSQPTEPSEAARHRASVHAEDRGESYVTLRSLEEARMMDHTAVIMRGGVSGQVYLTVPVKYVGTDEPMLNSLVRALDAFEFGEPHTATTRYELAPIGSGIDGGRGGGYVIDGVWLHPRLSDQGLLPFVSAVVAGRQSVDDGRTQFAPAPPTPDGDSDQSGR